MANVVVSCGLVVVVQVFWTLFHDLMISVQTSLPLDDYVVGRGDTGGEAAIGEDVLRLRLDE